jgi:hypothetical protein
MDLGITGKVALVTGGTHGIGRSCSEHMLMVLGVPGQVRSHCRDRHCVPRDRHKNPSHKRRASGPHPPTSEQSA